MRVQSAILLQLLLALPQHQLAASAANSSDPDNQYIYTERALNSNSTRYHHPAALVRAKQRCSGTKHDWCSIFFLQPPAGAAQARPPPDKACPNNCSQVGVCNYRTGMCDCPAGWTGSDCTTPQKRPCSAGRAAYHGPGTQPSGHINQGTKQDLDWTAPGWSASRCGGICDDDKGHCFCDGANFGRIPAPNGSAPGTPPIRAGRPLIDACQPSEDAQGWPAWGSATYLELYGLMRGWCNVAVGVPPARECPCHFDGLAGRWCEENTEHFCVNQCSGHGRCDTGFCHCDSGWFGHDCANRAKGQGQPDNGTDSQDEQAVLRERPWLNGHLMPPPATRTANATRRRPLIFVYDVPALYAARMLQYRAPKGSCVWRHFDAGNTTRLVNENVYSAETLLHEMLLQSPHRTLDPEEADFFFVPAYTSCFMWPVFAAADYPYWFSAGNPRVSHAAIMLLELKQHIQQAYPYWNRTQGRDHIWLATHDEGACWFPTEVYENSIILTHWGRMGAHSSNTAYEPDNYSAPKFDNYLELLGRGHAGEQQSWTSFTQNHHCYMPGKDLVIPQPKMPSHYRWSPLLGAPAQPRHTLLYFKGDVGKQRLANYSRGIRQGLFNAAQWHNWFGKFNVTIGDRNDVPGDYSLGLASSRFCLVAPGDGWSARFEDAVLHGCVPVIIQDGVHVPFESVIDVGAFSVRIPESQLTDVPQLLLAIPSERLRQMQLNLRRVWHRFAYLSQPLLTKEAANITSQWRANATAALAQDVTAGEGQGRPLGLAAHQIEDDAFGTIVQWLAARAHHRNPHHKLHSRHKPPT